MALCDCKLWVAACVQARVGWAAGMWQGRKHASGWTGAWMGGREGDRTAGTMTP